MTMKVSYYPGCTLKTKAKNLDDAAIASMAALGIELEELPRYHRKTIPTDYLDVMGHMNIKWYMALYDRAAWNFFFAHGLDETYYREQQAGVFAFKHFIQYYAEVRVGQTVAVRTRLLGRSEKRFH